MSIPGYVGLSASEVAGDCHLVSYMYPNCLPPPVPPHQSWKETSMGGGSSWCWSRGRPQRLQSIESPSGTSELYPPPSQPQETTPPDEPWVLGGEGFQAPSRSGSPMNSSWADCQSCVRSQSMNSLRQKADPGSPLNEDCGPPPLGRAAGSPGQTMSITCIHSRMALLPLHMHHSNWRCMGRSQREKTLSSGPSLRPMEPIRVGGSRKEVLEEANLSPESPLALLGLGRGSPLPLQSIRNNCPLGRYP
jgi:hypothetical protein